MNMQVPHHGPSGRHVPRCHPIGAEPESEAIEIVRLHRGLLAALGPVSRFPVVMVTGAASGVGTSQVVRSLGDAVSRSGVPTASFDLSAAEIGLDPLIARTRMMPGGAPLATPGEGAGTHFRDPSFSLVLVDAAPIRTSGLAMSLAASLDGIVLVIEADRTPDAEIRSSLQAIADCGGRCLGLVLNKARRRRRWLGLHAG